MTNRSTGGVIAYSHPRLGQSQQETNLMKSFVLNRHGSLVLPSNLFAQLDFSVITSLAQFESIVKRDMESKAPTGTEILTSIEAGRYRSRIELLRDVALNLY